MCQRSTERETRKRSGLREKRGKKEAASEWADIWLFLSTSLLAFY